MTTTYDEHNMNNLWGSDIHWNKRAHPFGIVFMHFKNRQRDIIHWCLKQWAHRHDTLKTYAWRIIYFASPFIHIHKNHFNHLTDMDNCFPVTLFFDWSCKTVLWLFNSKTNRCVPFLPWFRSMWKWKTRAWWMSMANQKRKKKTMNIIWCE